MRECKHWMKKKRMGEGMRINEWGYLFLMQTFEGNITITAAFNDALL